MTLDLRYFFGVWDSRRGWYLPHQGWVNAGQFLFQLADPPDLTSGQGLILLREYPRFQLLHSSPRLTLLLTQGPEPGTYQVSQASFPHWGEFEEHGQHQLDQYWVLDPQEPNLVQSLVGRVGTASDLFQQGLELVYASTGTEETNG